MKTVVRCLEITLYGNYFNDPSRFILNDARVLIEAFTNMSFWMIQLLYTLSHACGSLNNKRLNYTLDTRNHWSMAPVWHAHQRAIITCCNYRPFDFALQAFKLQVQLLAYVIVFVHWWHCLWSYSFSLVGRTGWSATVSLLDFPRGCCEEILKVDSRNLGQIYFDFDFGFE